MVQTMAQHPNPNKTSKSKKRRFNFIKAVGMVTKPLSHTFNKIVNTQLSVEKGLAHTLSTNFLPILIAGVAGLYLLNKK